MGRAHYSGARRRTGAAGGPISDYPLINAIHRNALELISAVWLLYILLGTLIPFDLSLRQGLGPQRGPLGLGDARSGLPDVLANVGLYVPLGALVFAVLYRRGARPWLALLLTSMMAAGVSVAVESLQLLSASRISSFVDFCANACGAALGGGLAMVGRRPAGHWTRAVRRRAGQGALPVAAQAWGLLLVVAGLAPFTPAADVSRIKAAWRQSTVVPFAQAAVLGAQAEVAQRAGDTHLAVCARRDQVHLGLRWTGEFLSFAAFGWLLHALLRRHYGFGAGPALVLAVYVTAGLAALMSLMQLGILSRGFHVTDILFRIAGATCGYLTGRLGVLRAELESGGLSAVGRRLMRPVLVTVLVCLVVFALAPFAFDWSIARAVQQVSSPEFLPFYSHYVGRLDRVCADGCAKLLLFGLCGALLWVRRPPGARGTLRAAALRIAGVGVLLSAALESAQLFVRSRVASLTDVFLAGVAAWLGVICVQYALDFFRHAAGQARRPASQAASSRPMSPTDTLVATLIPEPPAGSADAVTLQQPAEHQ